ncbi:dysbindin (dystrobrevin binding protein 1) domain containing 1, partial [Nothobranchius furzeri]
SFQPVTPFLQSQLHCQQFQISYVIVLLGWGKTTRVESAGMETLIGGGDLGQNCSNPGVRGVNFQEPNKDIQKLLRPSSSGDLSKELFQHPSGEAEGSLSGHTASLLHISEKRRKIDARTALFSFLSRLTFVLQPLPCVCSSGSHQPLLPRGGYMRSPSWTRCSKVEPPRERKHHSDSDTAEPLMKLERPKHP